MERVRGSTQAVRAVGQSVALRRALFAYFVFNAAEWGTWIAMLVYAFRRGGTTAAGVVATLQLVPAAIVAPAAAVLGDRMRRDRALALGYVIQAAAMGVTAAVLWIDAPTGVVYTAAVAAAMSVTLTRPVHNAALPGFSSSPEELTAANAISVTIEGLALFVGPLVTGVLLATSGSWSVFAFFAAGHAIGAVLIVSSPVRAGPRDVPTERFHLKESLEAFREIRRRPGAAVLMGFVGVEFVIVGMSDVLAVVLAFDILGLGPSGPTLMASAIGVGGLLGGAASVSLVGRRRLAPAVGLGILILGVPFALTGFSTTTLEAVALLAIAGAGKSLFDVGVRTLLQRSVRDEVLARVFGLQEGLTMLALAIGSIAVPPLVAWLGARGAFVASGVFLPAFGALGWRRLRAMDELATQPGPELDLLRSVSIFRPLAAPVIERLSRNLLVLDVAAGREIVRQGDPGDLFYVVRDGQVEVSVDGRRVATLGSGGFFGEIALLRNVPRTATVKAVTPVRLLALSREEFLGAVTGSRVSAERANQEVDRILRASGPGDEPPPQILHI